MPTCPNGHDSSAADFCSVCGAEIGAAAAPVVTPVGRVVCPVCTTPRESPLHAFCEVCGYNYRTGEAGIPQVADPLPAAPAAPATAPPAAKPAAVRWDVVVEVDANLYGEPHPDAPVGHPAQTFTLFDPEGLIGRPASGVRVQVPVGHDPGVSRRQAILVRRPDGGLAVRDLGSANGTQLNGRELLAGVDEPLKDGDVLAVGAWTRITIREVRS
jgi:hypothetical protein